MSHTWTISAGGRVYGPYTAERMQGFVAEGRLAPHSMIAKDGVELHTPALSDPEIALFFKNVEVREKPADIPAQAPRTYFEKPAQTAETVQPRFGRGEAEPQTASRFIVMADMKSNSLSGLEDEIQGLGLTCMLVPQTWLLTSELSISEIRNRLIQKLGKLDTLFLVDASNNKAAWFNFGPESDAKFRRIWQKAQEPASRRAV